MSDEDYDDKPISQLPVVERHKVFVEWYKNDSDAGQPQLDRERDDISWQIPENQWSSSAKEERKGRPMIAISLTAQPISLIKNQAAAAQLGVDMQPVSEKATKELAEIKQGLFQRIQRDGGAAQAREWAFDRAVQAGRGFYRIVTQWDEDGDHPSDQEIAYKRILHQEMVRVDAASEAPDFSDAQHIFVGGYWACRAIKQQYPKAKSYRTSDFEDIAFTQPEWVRLNGKSRQALVVELFYKESTYEPVKVGDYERLREVVVVRRAVLSGCEILEDEPYIINIIPIVP